MSSLFTAPNVAAAALVRIWRLVNHILRPIAGLLFALSPEATSIFNGRVILVCKSVAQIGCPYRIKNLILNR
jgi:hypothetical protein